MENSNSEDSKQSFVDSIHKIKFQMNNNNNLNSKLNDLKERLLKSDHSSILEISNELFNHLRETLFYKLEAFQENLPTIKILTEILLKSLNKFLSNSDSLQEFLSLLENTFYLFIFHFNIEIISLALKILNLLLKEIDYDFHKETLQKVIKIILILKMKRTVNPTVCNRIITNLAMALNLIIHCTNSETKKSFYDFILTNSEDLMMIWVLCNNCTHELNFSKLFQVESISAIVEKYSKELEKTTKVLDSTLQNFKTDNSLSSKNKIKQLLDVIGMICKIIDSFNIRGNRSYNYDKLIKMSLIPIMRRFWNLILFVNESQFYEIDFAVESIQSIITLCDSIDCMKFDILLPLLNWIGLLLEKNNKYVVNLSLIVRLISNTNLPEETSNEIITALLEILEKVLCHVKISNLNEKELSMNREILSKEKDSSNSRDSNDSIFKYYIVMILDSLEKFKNSFIIKDELKNCKEFYTSIKEGKFVEENNLSSMMKGNSEVYIKEYKQVLNPSTNVQNDKTINTITNLNSTKNKFLQVQNSLTKYEEFKNSLKTIYNLNNRNLTIDNKIANYIEKENTTDRKEIPNQINLENYENFFLETSIEMFREIFGYQK